MSELQPLRRITARSTKRLSRTRELPLPAACACQGLRPALPTRDSRPGQSGSAALRGSQGARGDQGARRSSCALQRPAVMFSAALWLGLLVAAAKPAAGLIGASNEGQTSSEVSLRGGRLLARRRVSEASSLHAAAPRYGRKCKR